MSNIVVFKVRHIPTGFYLNSPVPTNNKKGVRLSVDGKVFRRVPSLPDFELRYASSEKIDNLVAYGKAFPSDWELVAFELKEIGAKNE